MKDLWHHRATALLTHRHLPWMLVGLALILSFPAFNDGYQADDLAHQVLLHGRPYIPEQDSALPQLFTFMDGDPEHNRALMERGLLTWWTPLEVRASLWRPLSVLTHMVDHALAPGQAWVAHIHSVLWYLAVVLLAWWLYRRLEGPGALAGLAALLYTIDDSHGMVVAWLANRNAMLCTALGIVAIGLHDRWRREGWRPGALVGPLAFAAGLLAGEAAIGVLAFVFAHAMTLDPGRRWRDHAVALAPYAGVVVVWRVIYNLLGHGVEGSGLYIDPVRSPLAFAAAATERLPVLLFDQWASFPSMVVSFAPEPFPTVALVMALGTLAGVAALLVRALEPAPEVRFWALSMVLAAIPLCATFPYNRTLWFVGLSGAALVAHLLRALATAPEGLGRPARWAVVALAALHLGLSPLLMIANGLSIRFISDEFFHACERSLPVDPALARQTAVFVNASELCVAHVLSARWLAGQPEPRSIRLLASAVYDLDIQRLDERTLEIRPGGGYHSIGMDQLFRAGDDPLPVGTRIDLGDMSVEITEHNAEGFTSAARFRFRAPLEDTSLVWRAYRDGAVVPFEPPAVGQTIHLPRMMPGS